MVVRLASIALVAAALATGPAAAQQVGAPSPYSAPQPFPQPGFAQPGVSRPEFPQQQPGYPPSQAPLQGGSFPGAMPPSGGMQGGTWSWPPQGSAWPVQPGAQETVAPDSGQSQPLTPGAPAQTHVPGFVRTPSAPTPQMPGQESFPPPQFAPPPQ